MKSPLPHSAVAAATLIIFVVGCSDTPEKLYPVTGTVSVGGVPLNGGTVQFEMLDKGESSGKIYTAGGEIDASGNYELSTFGELGAPAGEHRVWVTPNFAAIPDKIGVSFERASPVPKKYMTPAETELTFTVAESENVIEIDVPNGK